MAARHRKSGGRATGGIAWAGGNPDVKKEAEEKKRGGKAMGKVEGGKSRMRLDKPGRKTGGRVGADKSPLSSANASAAAQASPKSQTGGMSS